MTAPSPRQKYRTSLWTLLGVVLVVTSVLKQGYKHRLVWFSDSDEVPSLRTRVILASYMSRTVLARLCVGLLVMRVSILVTCLSLVVCVGLVRGTSL